MKLDLIYCRACRTSHPPGEHKPGRKAPCQTSATVPSPARSSTPPVPKPSATLPKAATVKPSAAKRAKPGTSAKRATKPKEPTFEEKLGLPKKPKAPIPHIVQAFKKATNVSAALDVLRDLSRVELEALAANYVVEKARKQKAKANAMRKWRATVREAVNG